MKDYQKRYFSYFSRILIYIYHSCKITIYPDFLIIFLDLSGEDHVVVIVTLIDTISLNVTSRVPMKKAGFCINVMDYC